MITLNQCPICKSDSTESLVSKSLSCDNDMDWFFAHQKESKTLNKQNYIKYFKSNLSICNSCTLIFRASRETKNEIDHIYDLFQHMERRRYVIKNKKNEWRFPEKRKVFLENQNLFARNILEILENYNLINNKNISILNIRTEAGSILNILKKAGLKNTYGVDYFPENIEYARSAFGLDNTKILTGHDYLDSNNMKYDLILANHTFTHAYNPLDLFIRIRGMLKEGGVVLSYNEMNHKETWKLNPFNAGLNAFHKQFPTENSIRNAFSLSGFSVESIKHPKGMKFASVHNGIMSILRRSDHDDVKILNDDLSEIKNIFNQWWQRHQKIKNKKLFINKLGIYKIRGKINALRSFARLR